MLFRKKISRSCSYCANGAQLENDTVLCSKKGIRNADRPCMKFKYDPCKRVPPRAKAMDFSQYTDQDFTL